MEAKGESRWQHPDLRQFNDLLDRYRADFAPETAHEEFFVSQMTGARWKLDGSRHIENDMFAALENPARQ